MKIDFNLTNSENVKDYVVKIANDIIKATSFVACLFNGNLIAIQDDAIMYIINLKGKVPDNSAFVFEKNIEVKNGYIFGTLSTPRDEINTYTSIVSYYHNINNSVQYNPIIYINNNLKEDPDFKEFLNIKAPDGVKKFFIKTPEGHPFIPIMNGFPNLNKQDNLGIIMHDLGNHNILVREQIYKQKLKLTYDIIYKILDVNRPLYY